MMPLAQVRCAAEILTHHAFMHVGQKDTEDQQISATIAFLRHMENLPTRANRPVEWYPETDIDAHARRALENERAAMSVYRYLTAALEASTDQYEYLVYSTRNAACYPCNRVDTWATKAAKDFAHWGVMKYRVQGVTWDRILFLLKYRHICDVWGD